MDEEKEKRLVPFNAIKRKDKTNYVYVKSGYNNLDLVMGGYILGQVSVWSGLNGSGKSAFLNQQAVEFVMQGYKVMLFSGELMDYSVKNIIYRLIAGKKYLTLSDNGIYYYLKHEGIKQAIDDFIADRLYIYDNNSSRDPKVIMETIEYAKEKHGVQVVILDNLMVMNLKKYGTSKYEAQSEFVKEITQLAKRLEIHIHIVMHPTKTTGFLRKNDISGSADLSNAVDNVFIVHRNSNDFKRAYKEFQPFIKDDDELFKYNTYVEICKNREEGIQDRLLPYYFLRETKQIVEVPDTEKNYISSVQQAYYDRQAKS